MNLKLQQGLSVNIITYNGASAFLEQGISSVSSYADEILVYDSGSVDNTKQMLQKFCKVRYFYKDVQGLGQTWTNSKKDIELTNMLNELKDNSNYEWILKIDDDEIFPKEIMKEIRGLVEASPEQPIFSLSFLHVGKDCQLRYIKRLFKNIPDVAWQGIYGTETLAFSGRRVNSKHCPMLKNFFIHLGGLRQDLNDREHNYDF